MAEDNENRRAPLWVPQEQSDAKIFELRWTDYHRSQLPWNDLNGLNKIIYIGYKVDMYKNL